MILLVVISRNRKRDSTSYGVNEKLPTTQDNP
jgi:hypothetical protein